MKDYWPENLVEQYFCKFYVFAIEFLGRAHFEGWASVLISKELQMAKKIDSISPTGGMLTWQTPLKSPESKPSPPRR